MGIRRFHAPFHCVVCGQTFARLTDHQRHVGPRACRPAARLGLTLNAGKYQ